MISAKVAPLGRPIIFRIFVPLVSARGVPASFARAGLEAFLRPLASFFGLAALVLPFLAVFWPSRAPFFWLAPFFEEAFSGATCAPGSAAVAAVFVSGFVMFVSDILFCASFAHDDSSL